MSDVLERFMRYVQVDSQSDPDNMDVTPSTSRQHDMASFLGDELREIGCVDVSVDEHAYVTGTLPASAGAEKCPREVPGASALRPHRLLARRPRCRRASARGSLRGRPARGRRC